MNPQNEGYIYIMINACLPKNMLKIGYTKRDPEIRAVELSQSTGLPSEYIVAYERLVSDCELSERLIHEKLEKYRPTSYRNDRNREFFSIELKNAIKIMDSIADEVGCKKIKTNRQKTGNRAQAEKLYKDALNENIPGLAIQKMTRAADYGHVKANKWLKSLSPGSTYLHDAFWRRGQSNLEKLNRPEIVKNSELVLSIVEESVQDFKKAIELKPDNHIYYVSIGSAFLTIFGKKSANYDKNLNNSVTTDYINKAIEYLHKAIKIEPNYHHTYTLLASAYGLFSNDPFKQKKAVECYKKAIELNPKYAEYYNSKIKEIHNISVARETPNRNSKKKWWNIF